MRRRSAGYDRLWLAIKVHNFAPGGATDGLVQPVLNKKTARIENECCLFVLWQGRRKELCHLKVT